jgi:hypothetical protein
VDHLAATPPLASASLSFNITTKSAPLLEAHLGVVVGACAAMIAEAASEFQNGGLSPRLKGNAGEFIWQLFRLREFMLPNFPEVDRIAKERGVEALVACDFPIETAEWLVGEVMTVLGKIVRDLAN